MYQNLKRTCRAIVFVHKAFCFVALSLPSRFRKVPIRTVTRTERRSEICGLYRDVFGTTSVFV